MGIPKIAIFFVSGLLFLGTLSLPNAYYVFMRFLACGAFTWAATVAFDRNLPIIFWTSVALTILYNPIIDLYISSQIWIALDLISAAFLLLIHKRIQEHPSQPYRTT